MINKQKGFIGDVALFVVSVLIALLVISMFKFEWGRFKKLAETTTENEIETVCRTEYEMTVTRNLPAKCLKYFK